MQTHLLPRKLMLAVEYTTSTDRLQLSTLTFTGDEFIQIQIHSNLIFLKALVPSL